MKLFDACGAIEASRKQLFDSRVAICAFDQALKRERQNHLECSQAYKVLHTQYDGTLTDLNNMASKCLSLHRELEEAQQTIYTNEMLIGEDERRPSSGAISGGVKDQDIDQADWDMMEPAIAKTEQLEARIKALENEKASMIREHDSALFNAADRIIAAERKLDELIGEKADMTQDHQNALYNAANRISIAERKIHEFEKMHLALGSQEESVQIGSTATSEQIPSPSAGKRQRPRDEQSASTQQKGEPTQKTRKRRQVAKAKGASMTVS
jgi:hypothetical protein